ncbi:rod shape-determining protein RodA [Oculatella sp. LEGE 06141]|uniref:rod shape-determining protein RodA n=1 Tax=Oculatella sp. LEGE 06141 TaxID=1828648 RepID=UPI001881C37F|nr:rod shape-determining protein RodA [Oculatella sp. LEGE 06141]MBE9179556.1 rod shape-determining protein RodA [Oculatella sp. LEGE 06141]
MLKQNVSRIRWRFLTAPWQEADWFLLLLVLGLTVLGSLMIRSVGLNQDWIDWRQHWIIGVVGVLLALAIAQWRYEVMLRWHWLIYGITNLLLLAVMVVGTTELGAQRWITIGGFNIQPSEFAKVGLIITLASLIQKRLISSVAQVARILAVAAVPWVLVFLQPDLGTSLVFGAITFGMLYWGNMNPGWLVLLFSPLISAILFSASLHVWFVWVGIVGIVAWRSLPWRLVGTISATTINLIAGGIGHLLWELLHDYQRDRLILFLDPHRDPLGGGYHLIQSRIAIGAGQLFGQGLNQGTQTQLNFIPEQHTDFIFSAIGEELGFVGALVVLLIFWLVCLRLVIIAQNAKDNFGSLLAIGVLSMLVFQVLVNIGMTVGLAPVAGIPLPWLSYGRSALLTNFIAIGLVESVYNYRKRLKF